MVVLASAPRPRATTNPYITMLLESLEQHAEVRVVHFSWREALLGRYDVVHAHWPEIWVQGRTPVRRLARQGLTAAFLTRLTLGRVPVVRTVHNLEPHEGRTRAQQALLDWFDRLTTLRIVINDATVLPEGVERVTILHGHYRDWFAAHPRAARHGGRLAYVGGIARYKGVDLLLDAFARTAHPAIDLSLTVSGRPSSSALAEELGSTAAADPRVTAALRFIEDDELVAAVTGAQLVVLPYREMHNSGAALAALSLDRPVLVPDNGSTARLAQEVGEQWVQRFTGTIGPDALLAALEAVSGLTDDDRPDLGARGWDRAADDHVSAYRRAVQLRRGGRA
jgi:glycosyltransferase involved in cell wall biosynthesis